VEEKTLAGEPGDFAHVVENTPGDGSGDPAFPSDAGHDTSVSHGGASWEAAVRAAEQESSVFTSSPGPVVTDEPTLAGDSTALTDLAGGAPADLLGWSGGVTAPEPQPPPEALVQGVGVALWGGRLKRVLAAGTGIPTAWSRPVPPPRPGMSAEVGVFESPTDRATDAVSLGKLTVPSPPPDGGDWLLSLEVDADAVLKVTAHPVGRPDLGAWGLFALENTTARGQARVARAQRDHVT
jgi:hypothetical protein